MAMIGGLNPQQFVRPQQSGFPGAQQQNQQGGPAGVQQGGPTDRAQLSPEARGAQATQALTQGLQQVGQAEQAGDENKVKQATQGLTQAYQGASQSGALEQANKEVVKAVEDKLGIKKGGEQGQPSGGAGDAGGGQPQQAGGPQGSQDSQGSQGSGDNNQQSSNDKCCPNCNNKVKKPLDNLLGNRANDSESDSKAGAAGSTTINNNRIVNNSPQTNIVNGDNNKVSNSIDQSVGKTSTGSGSKPVAVADKGATPAKVPTGGAGSQKKVA